MKRTDRLAGIAALLQQVLPKASTLLEQTTKLSPSSAPAAERVASAAVGRFIAGTYSSSGGRLSYKLYVPSGYRGEALALVVMLHGCTQSADDFAAGTQMNARAEEQMFLVLYPEQSGTANASRCWNWFNVRHQRRGEGEPSLIAGLTRHVMHEYVVDASRVFAAGLSAGAAEAAILATVYPELYTAIGMHSGLPYGAANNVPSAFSAMRQGASGELHSVREAAPAAGTRTVPVIVFHGDRDTTVHPSNSDRVIERSRSGAHSMNSASGHVPGGRAYSFTRHLDRTGKPVCEQWVVHGAGHAWSGGSVAGSYTDPLGPDATREILRFFFAHGCTVVARSA